LRAGLVALQIACATVLASSAGLMLQTLANRERVDLGFQPHGAVRADLTLPANGNPANRLLASLNHHPDIQCAAIHAWALSRGAGASLQIDRPGAPRAAEAVSPAYFEAMGIPIRQGRVFSDADRSGDARVAIVNEEFARLAWPDRSPVGETLRLNQSLAVTIVGVVGSIRASGMHEGTASRIYLPYDQVPNSEIELVVRARTGVARTIQAMQTTVRNTGANLALDELRTLDADVARYLAPVRSLTILYSAFGIAGFLLAALGVFGAMSYNVSQRRREMAVRAALGADPRNIFLLVVRRALLIAIAGAVPGVFGASLAARSLRSFLFGVAPVNPPALAFAGVFLAIISLIACYAPARAAASTDPMTALRLE
jgi:putative ABC transport system permease protein